MLYSWNTEPVLSNETGTGWTLDVTDANLSTRLDERDFVVVFDGDIIDSSQFTKVSPTTLRYNGAATGGVTVEVRRDTDASPFRLVSYTDVILSGDYNRNLERVSRNLEEIRQFGNAPIGEVSLSAASYSSNWEPDASGGATRSALFDKFEAVEGDYQALISTLTTTLNAAISLRAPIESPNFSGSPTAPSPALGNSSTRLATTQFVQGNLSQYTNTTTLNSALALKANLASPALTGVPTAPTAVVSSSDTTLATTAHVKLVAASKDTTGFAYMNGFGQPAGQASPAAYRYRGMVTLLFNANFLFTGFGDSRVAGRLPVGYRPSAPVLDLVFLQGIGGTPGFGVVIVKTNGDLQVFNLPGYTGQLSQVAVNVTYPV